jgi:hypothetical protein
MAQGDTMQRTEIRVEGHIDSNWAEWLDGLTLTHTEEGETVLTGSVKDQAALYGLIAKLRDLGVKLISVNSVPQPREDGAQNTSSDESC